MVQVCGRCFIVFMTLLNSFLNISLSNGYSLVVPSPEQLAQELSSGTIHSWAIDSQLPTTNLSVKYVILYKIGIGNWYPTTHASTISTALMALCCRNTPPF